MLTQHLVIHSFYHFFGIRWTCKETGTEILFIQYLLPSFRETRTFHHLAVFCKSRIIPLRGGTRIFYLGGGDVDKLTKFSKSCKKTEKSSVNIEGLGGWIGGGARGWYLLQEYCWNNPRKEM